MTRRGKLGKRRPLFPGAKHPRSGASAPLLKGFYRQGRTDDR